MSNYTTEVRYICEAKAGLTESKGQNDVNSIIASSMAAIFNFDFPIFNEQYRSVLETKILKHYYTREIAFESVGLWQLKLDTRLNEIMPYYNKLYNSELITFNPLYNTDYTLTHEGERNDTGHATDELDSTITTAGSTESDSSSSSTGWDKFSDTPQGAVSGIDNDTYLTNARKTTDSGTAENDTSYSDTRTQADERENNTIFNSLDEYTNHMVGKMGTESYSELLNKFRETFLNIDMMIINDLSDLFFNLY